MEVDSNGYDEKVQEAKLDPNLAKRPERLLTIEEEKSLRSSLGMLAWLGRIARPVLSYEYSYIFISTQKNLIVVTRIRNLFWINSHNEGG